jgi:type IV secretion system protein VirB9
MTHRFVKAISQTAALSAVALWLACQPAHAVKVPRPLATDPRIKTVLYSPNEVIKFTGHYGYQSSIEFSPDEEIQTISIGDSVAWMMNPSGNRLFLKPVEEDATTNMTLITNRHTYFFELHADKVEDINDPHLTFQLRMVYPDEQISMLGSGQGDEIPLPDLENDKGKYNFNYSITGSELISPIRIFDDGQFTYFEFRNKNADVPAFYNVDAKGNEAMVNYRTRGDYIVIERVSARFTLRHGADVVCVYNEAMPKQAQTSDKKKDESGLGKLF